MNINFPRALRLGSFFFGLSSAGTKPEGTAAAEHGPECRGSSEAVVDHHEASRLVVADTPSSRLITWTTGRRQPEHRPHNTTVRHPRRALHPTVDYRIPGTTRTR
jgi:hypothetical protein